MAHLDQNELAERWSLSPRTLEQWRWRGVGPRYLKLGGRVIYDAVLGDRGAVMSEIRSEPEWFREFRLSQLEAAALTDGQVLGKHMRYVTEMLSRDQSGAAVEYMRHQADLAEAMLAPSAERPPAPNWNPWRRYVYRMDPADPDPVRGKEKTPTVDVALASGEALVDGDDLKDGDDEKLPQHLDPQLIVSRVEDAIDSALETDAEGRRAAEFFEADIIKLYSHE